MLSFKPCLALILLILVAKAFAGMPEKPMQGLEPVAPRLIQERWPAYWIMAPNAPKNEYGVYLFRKQFDLPAKPSRFVVHVTGDARYRLFVNGRSVSFGPQRSDTSLWRYESIDLAPFLVAGKNAIAAEVVSYGEDEPYAIMTLRTGFLLQGDTDAEKIVDTDASWKVTRDEAYRPFPHDRAALRTFIVVGPGDRVEGSLHPWGWETIDFDDHAWASARLLGHGLPDGWGTDVSWWLAPRTIPFMEETPTRFAYVRRANGVQPSPDFVSGKSPLTVPAHTKASVLLDQGFETNAFPQLTVSGGKGGRVLFTYAEGLFDAKGQKGNRDEID